MTEHRVGRRQTLKYLGILTGTVAGREFLAGWLPSAALAAQSSAYEHGAPAPTPDASQSGAGGEAAAYIPRFFEPDEFKTVELLAELIIPSDDTPGAKEAQVARYIDFVVFSAAEFKPSLQIQWKQGLALLDHLSREAYHRPFHEMAAGDQQSLLEAMSLPERTPAASHAGFDFFRLVKDMTVEGFYSSRVGLIDVLGYKGLSVMSEFPGCTHPEHQA
jgi:gluconate 2-dehydrogenase gamma chain